MVGFSLTLCDLCEENFHPIQVHDNNDALDNQGSNTPPAPKGQKISISSKTGTCREELKITKGAMESIAALAMQVQSVKLQTRQRELAIQDREVAAEEAKQKRLLVEAENEQRQLKNALLTNYMRLIGSPSVDLWTLASIMAPGYQPKVSSGCRVL